MENYLGEIRIFAGTFAPEGWYDCSGQSLAISQYDALFTLLGTTYGGDGQTTFNLPDLRSRVATGLGQGPGLSSYVQGQTVGTEGVTLTTQQMPAHNHALQGNVKAITGGNAVVSPSLAFFGSKGGDIYAASATTASLATDALSLTVAQAGGNQSHSNLQPTLTIRYIIAWQGIYPSQQ